MWTRGPVEKCRHKVTNLPAEVLRHAGRDTKASENFIFLLLFSLCLCALVANTGFSSGLLVSLALLFVLCGSTVVAQTMSKPTVAKVRNQIQPQQLTPNWLVFGVLMLAAVTIFEQMAHSACRVLSHITPMPPMACGTIGNRACPTQKLPLSTKYQGTGNLFQSTSRRASLSQISQKSNERWNAPYPVAPGTATQRLRGA